MLRDRVYGSGVIALRHPRQTRLKDPELDATVHGLEGRPRSLVRFLDENQDVQGPIARAFKEQFADDLVSMREFRGDLSITVKRESVTQVLRALKNDPQ